MSGYKININININEAQQNSWNNINNQELKLNLIDKHTDKMNLGDYCKKILNKECML